MAIARNSVKILLVDSDASVAEKVRVLIEQSGFSCFIHQVLSFDEFALKILDEDIDIILAEFSPFPEITAFELLEEKRFSDTKTPFIFLSRSVGEELAAECILAGASGFVLKSRMERLPNVLKRVLKIDEDVPVSIPLELRNPVYSPHQMLDVISRAMIQFVGQTDHDIFFESLLDSLILMTQSTAGFISEIYPDSSTAVTSILTAMGVEYEESTGIYSLHWGEKTIQVPEIEELIAKVIFSGQPAFYGRSRDYVKYSPALRNFLGIPFFDRNVLVGVVVIMNAPEEYSEDLLDYLQPFLIMCANVVAAYRNDNRRRLVEKYLRDSEHQYREVVDNLTEVIFKTDGVGIWTFLNPAWTDITGFSLEESIGTLFLDYVHPDDRERNAEYFKPLMERKKDFCRHIIRYLTKDGSFRWIEVYARLTLDADNNPTGTAGTLNDITDRIQAEQEIDRQKNLMTTILDAIPVNIFLKDEQHRFVFLNEWTAQTLGISQTEAIGKTDYNLFSREYADKLRETDVSVWKNGILRTDEEKIEVKGRELYMYAGKTIISSKEKEPLLLGFSFDITDRKKMEIELENQKQFNWEVINSDPNLIFVRDWEGNFIMVNQAVADLFGTTIEQVIYQHNLQLHSNPEELDHFSLIDRKVIETREEVNVEESMTFGENDIRWYFTTKRPLVRSDGVVHVLGISVDITNHKRAEEDIKRALEQERELNELKSRFVSMISHEFRTPLSTILSSAELMQRYWQKWTEEKREEHLRRIEKAVSRMTTLLDDVLFIGRTDSNKLGFSPIWMNLDTFCAEIAEEMRLSGRGQQAIHYSAGGDLSKVLADEKLLRHILLNLLSNAMKYSPPESTVEFNVDSTEEAVIFVVKDSGIGIPAEDQKRLFEVFHRASNVGNVQGTGLGLSIVKRSVDIHGGTISVQSAINIGTTFTVTIPIHR